MNRRALSSFSNILITGASSGIGATLGAQLAAPGRTLGLMGRDAIRLAGVAATCSGKGAQCVTGSMDICDHDAVSLFIKSFDQKHPIDLLVVNAGIFQGRRADQTVEDKETALRVLNTNLMAAIDCVHLCLPQMLDRGRGTILFMASLAAFFPLPDAPAYSASKAGLMSYGLALREAVGRHGISVVVACPGYVATPMVAKHRGVRLGEVSVEEAGSHILKGLQRNAALVGFPTSLFWLTRVSILLPEFMRRKAMDLFRFHID